MGTLNTAVKCGRCRGTGIDDNIKDEYGNPVPGNCSVCGGDGYVESGIIDITELIEKIDAIKAMLDSPTLGMQKMSSNLDDIMYKLDV